ncbi:hypothetical protein V6N13_096148 [Hibiscus sabdariffa]
MNQPSGLFVVMSFEVTDHTFTSTSLVVAFSLMNKACSLHFSLCHWWMLALNLMFLAKANVCTSQNQCPSILGSLSEYETGVQLENRQYFSLKATYSPACLTSMLLFICVNAGCHVCVYSLGMARCLLFQVLMVVET